MVTCCQSYALWFCAELDGKSTRLECHYNEAETEIVSLVDGHAAVQKIHNFKVTIIKKKSTLGLFLNTNCLFGNVIGTRMRRLKSVTILIICLSVYIECMAKRMYSFIQLRFSKSKEQFKYRIRAYVCLCMCVCFKRKFSLPMCILT